MAAMLEQILERWQAARRRMLGLMRAEETAQAKLAGLELDPQERVEVSLGHWRRRRALVAVYKDHPWAQPSARSSRANGRSQAAAGKSRPIQREDRSEFGFWTIRL